MTLIDHHPLSAAWIEREEAVDEQLRPQESRYATVRVTVAVACLLGAQLLHWSVTDQHAQEWRASGVFFFLLALAEGLMTVLIVTRLRPWVAATAIMISVVPVMVWAWDRTLGLPFGPTQGVRGTIGRSDVMSVIFEVLTIVVLWPFLRRGYGTHKPARLDLVSKVIIGITCLYVAGFSVWAMLGDKGSAIHHVGTPPVPTIVRSISPDKVAPLNASVPLNASAP